MVDGDCAAQSAVWARVHRNLSQTRIPAAVLVGMTTTLAVAQQTHPMLTLYKTVSSAACADDQPVWIDPKTQTYYVRGDRLYAKTRPGGYNCRKQAEAAGFHGANPR